MTGFLIRVEELRKKKDVSRSKMLKSIGLNANSFVNWEKRNSIPSGDVVAKIAQYLETTSDYLLEGKENDIKKETPSETGERWKAIYDKVDSLPDETKDKVLEKLPKLIDLLADQGQPADQ